VKSKITQVKKIAQTVGKTAQASPFNFRNFSLVAWKLVLRGFRPLVPGSAASHDMSWRAVRDSAGDPNSTEVGFSARMRQASAQLARLLAEPEAEQLIPGAILREYSALRTRLDSHVERNGPDHASMATLLFHLAASISLLASGDSHHKVGLLKSTAASEILRQVGGQQLHWPFGRACDIVQELDGVSL
jgi:hypothetical protein